jgi:hypothetical protein
MSPLTLGGPKRPHARYVLRYPGGVTLRTARFVLIVRWSGYVPIELPGWRARIGRVEIHARRMPR